MMQNMSCWCIRKVQQCKEAQLVQQRVTCEIQVTTFELLLGYITESTIRAVISQP